MLEETVDWNKIISWENLPDILLVKETKRQCVRDREGWKPHPCHSD